MITRFVIDNLEVNCTDNEAGKNDTIHLANDVLIILNVERSFKTIQSNIMERNDSLIENLLLCLYASLAAYS